MAEYLISQIRRRLKMQRVGIFVDDAILSTMSLEDLGKLAEKFKEIGSIKIQLLITSKIHDEDKIEKLTSLGFTIKVVPQGTEDMNFVVEVYDLVLDHNLEILVFATNREEFTHLITESRQKTKLTFLYITEDVSDSLRNSADEVLYPDELDQYYFEGEGIDEYFGTKTANGDETIISVDEISIGPISEGLETTFEENED